MLFDRVFFSLLEKNRLKRFKKKFYDEIIHSDRIILLGSPRTLNSLSGLHVSNSSC